MNKKIILVILLLVCAGGIVIYTITKKESTHTTEVGMHQMSDGRMMKDSEAKDGHLNHVMLVSSEREFIQEMIPHHQEAIDTAREVLERGGTTLEIKKLAEDIIIAQEQEIAQMKKWYLDWYNENYVDNGRYVPMMRNLSQLSGTELDRTFLEDMIGHHMGAIMMAQSVQVYIEHSEIKEISENIISTQSIEIKQMRQLLQDL